MRGWRLEVRRPVSTRQLGPWETLARVEVVAGLDDCPPAFAGIARAQATAAAGTVFRSPCEAGRDWVVRTTFALAAAMDDRSGRAELLYLLERRAAGDTRWTQWRTFRPAEQRFSFDAERAWDQEWEYRIKVRDTAGHETLGRKTARVRNPTRPSAPPPAQP